MTKIGAQRICQLAKALYGDQVDISINDAHVRGNQGYSAVLLHKGLNRRVSLNNVDDWPYLKEAWSAALEVRHA